MIVKYSTHTEMWGRPEVIQHCAETKTETGTVLYQPTFYVLSHNNKLMCSSEMSVTVFHT